MTYELFLIFNKSKLSRIIGYVVEIRQHGFFMQAS